MATGVDPVLVSSSLAANLRTIAVVASAGRGSPDSLAGVLAGVTGRVPNGAIAMLTTTYSLLPRESPGARCGHRAR